MRVALLTTAGMLWIAGWCLIEGGEWVWRDRARCRGMVSLTGERGTRGVVESGMGMGRKQAIFIRQRRGTEGPKKTPEGQRA